MAKKTELDELATFFIPDNFINKGTILGGLVKTRNFVEGVILGVGVGYPLSQLNIPVKIKIILVIVISVPLFAWGIFGANGGPLSEFLLDFFKYKKATNTYLYDSQIIKNKNTRSDKDEKA